MPNSQTIKYFILASITVILFNYSNAQNSMLNRKAIVINTIKDHSSRLKVSDTLYFKPQAQPLETEIAVFVDERKTFQQMLGIGAAITDASAETFAKVSPETQKQLLQDFFNPKTGIGYTLARTNINSCDFSSGSYTYVQEGDKSLKTFNIGHDTLYKIPLIKKAFAAANNQMKIYGSPWSPPAYMKDNNNVLGGGHLLPEYYQTWANYYVKFIKAYEKAGIPIWGISIQNEPMAKQRWESCIYTAEEERDFLKKYLGPTMQNSGMANKKIIIWDHNRDLLFHRASVILGDKDAAKYVWGIGYHWYETWAGGAQMHQNLDMVNEMFPDKNLIFTEGCKEAFNEARYNAWELGEYYASAMIKDFNNSVNAWTDWNIFLDEKGGPNHKDNFCFAPVHVNTKTNEIIYTNAYYYIGHFSKFIRPGARRLACASSRSNIQATAFKNTDGKIAVIVMNETEKEVKYTIQMNAHSVPLLAPAHSIQTIVY
jgi:glucosylceramidase